MKNASFEQRKSNQFFAVLSFLLIFFISACDQPQQYDLIFRNGMIVDGTGQAADIVIFNPGSIIDKATFQEPGLMSEGIIHTLVNGQFAWRNEEATGVQAGKALAREKPF